MAVEITPEEQLHWVALHLTPGVGAIKSVELIRRYRSPEAVFRAPTSEIEACGIAGGAARSITSGCTFDEALQHVERLTAAGATLIPITHPLYPERLRAIYDPPLVLYAVGRAELLASPMVAVVGTRRPTPYGLAAAERLSGDLSRAGVTVASGMARGIDTAAHRAALAAGGPTLAVFGCGVDEVYPAENRKLAAEIAAGGLLVSEFPMGSPAHPQNFPLRNRVISGLSAGVLVVEGAQYSGSAITARLGLDQGREVFAVPGNITSKLSWVPNLLIKQGAKLVQDVEDILVDLPACDQRRLPIFQKEAAAPSLDAIGPNGRIARKLMEGLPVDEAVHIDRLLESSVDFSSSEVIAALFELELMGMVRQLPGRKYVKVWAAGEG